MAPSHSRSYLRMLQALLSVPRVSSASCFSSDFPVSRIRGAAQGRCCTGRPWQHFLRHFSARKGEGDGGDRFDKGRGDASLGREREAGGSGAHFGNEKETPDQKTLTPSRADGESDEDDARLFGDGFLKQPFRVEDHHGQAWRDGESLRQGQGENDEDWGTVEGQSGGSYEDGWVPDSGEDYRGAVGGHDEFGAEGYVDPARDDFEGAYAEKRWTPDKKGYGPPMAGDHRGAGAYTQSRGWDSSSADGSNEYQVPPTGDWAGGGVEEPGNYDAGQTWSRPGSGGRMGQEGVWGREADGPQRLEGDGQQQDQYGDEGHAYAYRGEDGQQQDQYGDGGHAYAYNGGAAQQKDQYWDGGHAYADGSGYGEPKTGYDEAKPKQDLEGEDIDDREVHVNPYSGVLEGDGNYPRVALQHDYGSGGGEYSVPSVGEGGTFGDLIQRDGYTEDDINNLILQFHEPVKLPHLDDYSLIYQESETKKQRREMELAKMAEMAKRWVKKVDEHGFAHGVGRRKTSRARVWIREGEGKIIINKKHHDLYFPFMENRVEYLEPFIITGTMGMFDTFVLVRGGGVSGQAGAIRHGVSRALMWFDPTHRPILKRGGMLRRDDREVERKKPGKAKARKSYQWVKR